MNQTGPIVLRDPDAARQYLLQGLWFQRAVRPSASTVTNALTWSLAIADSGQPLPPTGLVADLGHSLLGKGGEGLGRIEYSSIPSWPAGMARRYEDCVLGKLYGDWSFERAGDALKRIEVGKQPVGLAYVIKQFRERGQFGGVEMSPGIIRGLLDIRRDENLRNGWEMLNRDGPMPLLIEHYEQVIAACRRLPEVLGLEDVIALEQKTALLTMAEYVAHRQVLQAAVRLEEGLSRHHAGVFRERREVPARILDEDAYPVGGFSSISTRGGIESLLHSQLAYMEKEKERQPDLFAIKYLRDELYYYARDENQFLRGRRTFVFLLHPDLALARFKDVGSPCQRSVLVLSMLLAAARRIAEFLSSDALRFEFVLASDLAHQPLEEERKLLELLYREQIENRTVAIQTAPADEIEQTIARLARRSLCHCLVVSVKGWEIQSDAATISQLRIDAPVPTLTSANHEPFAPSGGESFDGWISALAWLLQKWIEQ